jgi:hypothetical protein
VGFADRLLRKAGSFMTPGATVTAIDMATSDGLEPPGPTAVILTDAEVLLVSAGADASIVTKVSADQIVGVVSPAPGRVTIAVVDRDAGTHRDLGLDFRYFGEQDDTIARLLSEFGSRAASASSPRD